MHYEMWVVLAPAAAVFFVVVAIRNVRSSVSKSFEARDAELRQVVAVDPHPDTDPCAVFDFRQWLNAACDRLQIAEEPVMKTVQNSTFLTFASGSLDLKLWLAGEDFMGPFPRLSIADSEDRGLVFERTAEGLERAVLTLRRASVV